MTNNTTIKTFILTSLTLIVSIMSKFLFVFFGYSFAVLFASTLILSVCLYMHLQKNDLIENFKDILIVNLFFIVYFGINTIISDVFNAEYGINAVNAILGIAIALSLISITYLAVKVCLLKGNFKININFRRTESQKHVEKVEDEPLNRKKMPKEVLTGEFEQKPNEIEQINEPEIIEEDKIERNTDDEIIVSEEEKK